MDFGITLLKLLADRRLSVTKNLKLIFVEAPVGIKTWARIDCMTNQHNFKAVRRYRVKGE